MIRLSRDAERQIDALLRHYAKLGRPEAGRNLIAAVDDAVSSIRSGKAMRLAAPRPYPGLAKTGRLWTKSGRYWIAYTDEQHAVITGVFFEQADIPGRL